MKKNFASLVLILGLLMCFVSCDFHGGNHTDISDTEQSTMDSQANRTIYDILNEFAQINYKKVELDIITVISDIELKSNYVLTDSVVVYSVEQLNMLPTDGDVENTLSEYKTSLTGTAIIENGKVVKFDGESISIPSYDDLKGCFNFEESNFKNTEVETKKLTADVVSPSKFMGTDMMIEDMKIVVDYNSSALERITITYKTPHSTVTTVYTYEK